MSGSQRAITAGEAFIRFGADRKQLQKDLRAVAGDFRRWSRTLGTVGRQMGFLGLGMVGAVGALIPVVADAETAWKRFSLIFDQSAGKMQARLRRISKETGIAMTTLVEGSSAFGAIFAELRDISGDDVFVKVVGDVIARSTDLAALAGVSLPESFDKMKSAFTSTGEAVDQYGLNLRIANLENEALRIGMTKAVRDMTELEKQMLKLSLINQQFTRTGVKFVEMVDTLNGQFTLLTANLRELIVEGGWALRAVLIPMLRAFNKLLIGLRPVAKLLSPYLVLFGGLGGSLLVAGAVLTVLSFSLNQIAAAMLLISKAGGGAFFANLSWFVARSGLVTTLAAAFTKLGVALKFVARWLAVAGTGAGGILFPMLALSRVAAFAQQQAGGGIAGALERRGYGRTGNFIRYLANLGILPGTGSIRGTMATTRDFLNRGLAIEQARRGVGAQTSAALSAGTPSSVIGGRGAFFGPTGQSLAFSMAASTSAERSANANEGLLKIIDQVVNGERAMNVKLQS